MDIEEEPISPPFLLDPNIGVSKQRREEGWGVCSHSHGLSLLWEAKATVGLLGKGVGRILKAGVLNWIGLSFNN